MIVAGFALLLFYIIAINASTIPGEYGYVNIEDKDVGHLFYWMFEHEKADAPVVIWLNGGPGCSSLKGLLTENGPFHINLTTGAEYTNKHSWANVATYVAVDQPYGIGFSYIKGDLLVYYDFLVSREFVKFLTGFYKKYPHLQKNKLYITGQAYAGHYVPAISEAILNYNKKNTDKKFNFAGMAIGNGWTFPYFQYAHLDFAHANKLVPSSTYNDLKNQYEDCQEQFKNASPLDTSFSCSTILSIIKAENPGMSVHDIRLNCDKGECPNYKKVVEWLNDSKNQEILGVQKKFEMCNETMYFEWSVSDFISNLTNSIRAVLNEGYPALFYNGDKDLECDWMGELKALNAEFKVPTKLKEFEVSGAPSPAGWYSKNGKLTFVRISEAGQRVPVDQPITSLHVISKFLKGEDP